MKLFCRAIIPVEPSFFSLQGIARQMETLDLLSTTASRDIRARALITLYTSRSDFGKAIAEEIRQHLGGRHFNTVIRYSMKLPEAAGHGLPITEFSTRSAGFADYQSLAQEVLQQESTERIRSTFEKVAEETSSPPSAAFDQTDVPVEPRTEASPPLWTGEGVLFTIEAPGARCVQLAGDFNGWVADGNEMQPNGRIWRKVMPLPPGRYHYRYVVDGRWLADPLNVNVEPTPWGGYNSVIDLEGNDADFGGASRELINDFTRSIGFL